MGESSQHRAHTHEANRLKMGDRLDVLGLHVGSFGPIGPLDAVILDVGDSRYSD